MSPLAPILVSALLVAATGTGRDEKLVERPRYRIEVPPHVLTDVPVRRIVIRALDADGNVDASYNGQPLITGIRLSLPETDDAKLGAFHNGVLELTTDATVGRKVYVADPEIVVAPEDRDSVRLAVPRVNRWMCLVPALVAFVLCVWPRNFILSMFMAVLCGTTILARGNLFAAFVQTVDAFVVGDLEARKAGESSHILVLTVMLFCGSLFGVLTASGGLATLLDRLGRFAKTRNQGQILTWILGLCVFFDDYTHAIIVGKTLRPLSDRLKVSREKLAFLVDTTAAPVAALAVVSTWIAAERGPIRETFLHLPVDASATTTLIASLPYCFYPVLMLIFAALVIFTGNDFGPMFRAEWRAVAQGHLSRPEFSDPIVRSAADAEASGRRKLARNAWFPLVVLFGMMAIGLYWTGTSEMAVLAANSPPSQSAELPHSLLDILEHSNPLRVLLFSAFVASGAAIASAVWSRSLTLQESMDAWVSGMQRVVPAALILALSWSFQNVCDADHLNVAGFLMEVGRFGVRVEWVPLVAFGIVGLTSFVAGNAWAALPLALPLFLSVTNGLLVDMNEASPTHPILLATIGAVIAGTVFGHHCSPISNTTVLSSASSSCSHLDHVITQLPYAVTVAAVVAMFGYVPVAYGYSPVVLLPVCTAVLFAIVQFGGRPSVAATKTVEDKTTAAEKPTQGQGQERGPVGAEGQKPVAAVAGGKAAH